MLSLAVASQGDLSMSQAMMPSKAGRGALRSHFTYGLRSADLVGPVMACDRQV
jgi:hypothetical protein